MCDNTTLLNIGAAYAAGTAALWAGHYYLTRRSTDKKEDNQKIVLDDDIAIFKAEIKSNSRNILQSNSEVIARSKGEIVQDNSEVIARSKGEIVQDNSEVIASSKGEIVQDNSEVIARSKGEIVQDNSEVIARSKGEIVQDNSETQRVEFHILLKPTRPKLYERLSDWIPLNQKGLRSVGIENARAIATETVVGISEIQPMFTCVMTMNKKESIPNRLRALENLIARVVSDKNVSSTDTLDVKDKGYIEFHMKVHGIKTKEDWNDLAKFCAKYSVVLLFNRRSRNGPFPVTTYRQYRTNKKLFIESQNRIIEAFKAAGYRMSKIHMEISPDNCDTEPGTDIDWAIFQRYKDSWKDYFAGRKSFNECFRWIEESDFTEESYNPPKGWEEEMQKWLLNHPNDE